MVDVNSTIVWEVDGTQIHSTEQFNNYNTQGYSIQPMNTESESSNMTISMEARVSNTDSNIIVDCLAKHKNELGSNKWEIHHIILICEYNNIIIQGVSSLRSLPPLGGIILFKTHEQQL